MFYDYFTESLQNAEFKAKGNKEDYEQEKKTFRIRIGYNLQMPTQSLLALVKKRKDKEGQASKKQEDTEILTTYLTDDARGYQSILQRSMYLENSRFKEFYMDLAFWLGIISLDLFVTSLDDLLFLFNAPSTQVLNFFQHCF